MFSRRQTCYLGRPVHIPRGIVQRGGAVFPLHIHCGAILYQQFDNVQMTVSGDYINLILFDIFAIQSDSNGIYGQVSALERCPS